MTSAVETFDLVVHAERLEARLAAAAEELERRGNLAEEARWLAEAQQRVANAHADTGALLTRALALPELEAARLERARALQEAAMDAVDQLQLAIRERVGERSPVIDVLYMNLKLPPLRRAPREAFAAFLEEFERRLGSSYLKRMFADEAYQPVAPALEALARAFDSWRTIFSTTSSDEEAEALRAELGALGARLEQARRQALLLADAAFVSAEDLREPSRLFEKPARRVRARGSQFGA